MDYRLDQRTSNPLPPELWHYIKIANLSDPSPLHVKHRRDGYDARNLAVNFKLRLGISALQDERQL